MSVKLLLIRHAQSAWNLEPRLQGQEDPPLSDQGLLQAELLGAALAGRALAAVYSSPLQRAFETARAICGPHGLQPVPEAALREVHLGRWQGRSIKDMEDEPEYRAWKRDPCSTAPPSGESLEQIRARLDPFITEVLGSHSNRTVVLVTHSVTGRVLLSHLVGAFPALVRHLKLKVASISTIRMTSDDAVLERLGDTSHLRLDLR